MVDAVEVLGKPSLRPMAATLKLTQGKYVWATTPSMMGNSRISRLTT